MSLFSWLLVGAASLAYGGNAPHRACTELCDVIESCAAKVDHVELSNLLCKVARCETGETCKKRIRSPSGKFHGPFQFLPATWRKICHPLFKRKGIAGCRGKNAMSDPCCATMCVAEMIADNLNGGLKNWPACGRKAKREIAREEKKKDRD
jgi:hypothetical protein